ncbi:MAG TPA: AAA family ATPase [Gemmatimonadaceae bacterium]|nr:AAA family ATPase [Gemmatimonadaceae bacterium]
MTQLIPIDAHVYELWMNSGTDPWPDGQLGTFTEGVLLYGPRGCGKTFAAESICTEGAREKLEIDAVDVLKKPDVSLTKHFNAAKKLRQGVVLIEDIDNLFPSLRAHPAAHWFLREQLKRPTFGGAIVASARRPEMLHADELDAFTYVVPVFYVDQRLREVVMVSHVRATPIAADLDFHEVAIKTEWWSAKELRDLMAWSPRDGRTLTHEMVLERVRVTGGNIVTDSRRKRTQELLRFTAAHCTSNYIRENIEFRFGTSIPMPAEVPPPPNITLSIEQVIMSQEIKQAGVVVNPGGQASGFTVNQTLTEAAEDIDLEKLARGLVALRAALQQEPDTPHKPTAIAAVTEAEVAAKSGDRSKAIGLLAKAGKWSLSVATKIGESVAAAAIKAALDIK